MITTKVNCVDNRPDKTIPFENIPIGSWFFFEDMLYLKVKPYEVCLDHRSCAPYNAIDFDGIGYTFDQNEPTELVENIRIEVLK